MSDAGPIKLVGSLTEDAATQDLRDRLRWLYRHPRLSEIETICNVEHGETAALILLMSFADDESDVLTILTIHDFVVSLDVPWDKGGKIEVIKNASFAEYSAGLKRADRINLAVAQREFHAGNVHE